MRGVIIGTILACALLIGGALFITFNSRSTFARLVPLDSNYEKRVNDGYWKKGSVTPKVVLTEYMDFQDPSTLVALNIINDTMRSMGDELQFRLRMYPMSDSHPNALLAAKVAEAAGRQGKFWEMSDILLVHQQVWAPMTAEAFKKEYDAYAGSLRLNLDQFHSDIADSAITEPIDRDKAAANRIPLIGTPTFLINDELVNGFPPTTEALTALLRSKEPVIVTPTPTP
jgi:protein-disulfide isomerase